MTTFITSTLRLASISVGMFAASICTPAAALTVTLPTTNIDATSQFSFNSGTQSLMSMMGLNVTALGNSKQSDPSVWSFSMPVTQVSLDIGLFSLTPVSGKASGSALGITSEDGGLQLANFALDFKRNVLSADLITTSGTTKNFDVYNFNVDQGLHVSTTGGLSMQMALTQMKLTTGAQSAFADALALPDYAVAGLGKLDFGRLDINISPALRFNVSDKPYSASMVPEAPTGGMLAIGLVGLAVIARRKMQV